MGNDTDVIQKNEFESCRECYQYNQNKIILSSLKEIFVSANCYTAKLKSVKVLHGHLFMVNGGSE